ncbi:MAG TPA: hypothetical protein VL625_05445 [Patescibacteria group bacterium]|nr:hypothetical protein [Patescibacteria group bacterium]
MSPFEPEKNNDYAPNAVQKEFIRLCAEKYWYLAFGDSDHAIPELKSFMLSAPVLDALEEAGKKHYFIEWDPRAQYYFDYVRKLDEPRPQISTIDIERITTSQKSFGMGWFEGDVAKQLSRVFERNARTHRDIRFIAADQRHADHEQSEQLLKRLRVAELKALGWEFTLRAFHAVTGRYGDTAHRAARLFASNPVKNVIDIACQDRDTASYIKSFDTPSVLYYGMGHFFTPADEPQNPHMLGSLLPRDGKTMCVLNVYKNQAGRDRDCEFEELMPADKYARVYKPADAELFVFADEANPDGIRINNADLLPLYDQAIKNVQAGLTPHEMTRQFLPS